MSAPVTLQTSVWTDTRFDRLAKMASITRDDAVAKMARLWAEATNRETDVGLVLDIQIVFGDENAAGWVVNSELAEWGSDDEHIRYSGGDRLLWLARKRKNARSNGKRGGRPRLPKETQTKPTLVTKRNPNGIGNGIGNGSCSTEPVQETDSGSPSVTNTGSKPKKLHPVTESVIEFFNRKAIPGTKLRRRPLTHDERIRKLLKAGYTEQELRVVIWHKGETWGKDPEMQRYVQPSTLFRLKNAKGNAFPDYLEEAVQAWEEKNKREFDRDAPIKPREAASDDKA